MYSPENIVNNILYGTPKQNTVEFFRKQYEDLRNIGWETSNWFKNAGEDLFQRSYSDQALIDSHNLLRETAYQFRDDVFHYLNYQNYQPNLLMQRYIMANPTFFTLYKKDMVNGFGGILDNYERDVTHSKFRDDYLRTIDGLVLEDEVVYCSSSKENLDNLSIIEKSIICNSWEITKRLLANGEDPTELNNQIQGEF